MNDDVIPLNEIGKIGTVKVYNQAYVDKLEKQISILLSCKDCPDNKGGYICEKEYNDKCLSQKIQYIKELKEENAELKDQLVKAKEIISEYVRLANLEKEDTVAIWQLYHKAEQFIKE